MSHVIALRLKDSEWAMFQEVQSRNNLTAQQFLHAIVIDALIDEGYDALRCRQQEGCSEPRETGEVGGDTTS